MHVLLFLLFGIIVLVILVVVVAFSILGKIVSIFNFGNTKRQQTTQQETHRSSSVHKKIIAKDEGEYVDFEEVE